MNTNKFNNVLNKFNKYFTTANELIKQKVDEVKTNITNEKITEPTKEDIKQLREIGLQFLQPTDKQLKLLRTKLNQCNVELKERIFKKITFEGLSLLTFDKIIWMIDNVDTLQNKKTIKYPEGGNIFIENTSAFGGLDNNLLPKETTKSEFVDSWGDRWKK